MVKVKLRREKLEVNPVFSTAVAHRGPSGRPVTTGYIRLVNFSMHAAEDVRKAVRGLKARAHSLCPARTATQRVTAQLEASA